MNIGPLMVQKTKISSSENNVSKTVSVILYAFVESSVDVSVRIKAIFFWIFVFNLKSVVG